MMMQEGAELPTVAIDDAINEVAAGVALIDVRELDEWDAGHAAGATFIPLSELQGRVSELPQDSRFLLVCHGGGRSARATAFLRSDGLDAVNVDGGMVAWVGAGGPMADPAGGSHSDDSHSANSDNA